MWLLQKKKEYAIYIGVGLSLLQTIAQVAGHTGYNKLLFTISIEAYMINVVAALWAFNTPRLIRGWRLVVFNTVFYFTAILAPYSAVSVFIPQKFVWYLFATICMVITLFKCYYKYNMPETDPAPPHRNDDPEAPPTNDDPAAPPTNADPASPAHAAPPTNDAPAAPPTASPASLDA